MFEMNSSSTESDSLLTELKLPANAKITNDTKLGNAYISSDHKTVFLGWKKKDTDEFVSGFEDYAQIDCSKTGAGVYIRTPENYDYSFSGGTLTVNSGTFTANAFKNIMQNIQLSGT